ncbi:MAG TPA: hypothetical protein VIJ77_08485 [Candidatus Tumulicola sp.]
MDEANVLPNGAVYLQIEPGKTGEPRPTERFTYMGIKDAIEKTVENAKDALNEGGHRSAAEGERAKRELVGDEMTPGERVKSVANEAKENVQAEYDATKRNVRDKT